LSKNCISAVQNFVILCTFTLFKNLFLAVIKSSSKCPEN
jgi:hypothetical protein